MSQQSQQAALVLLNQIVTSPSPNPDALISLLQNQPELIPGLAAVLARIPLVPTSRQVRMCFLKIVDDLITVHQGDLFARADIMTVPLTLWMQTLLAMIEREVDPPVVNRAILCLTNIYPFIFKLTCQNVNAPWPEVTKMKQRLNVLFAGGSDGTKMAVIKMFQVLVVVQTPRDPTVTEGQIGLDLVPQQHHPHLNIQALYAEAGDYLNMLVALISQSSSASSGIMSAVVNCFLPLLRARPQFLSYILGVFKIWYTAPPSALTPWELRNAERSIRNVLIGISKLAAVAPHQAVVHDAIRTLTERQETTKPRPPKRAAPSLSSSTSKRARIDSPSPAVIPLAEARPSASTTPAAIDVNTLPLSLVVDTIFHVMRNMLDERWQSAIAAYCQAYNLPLPPNMSRGTEMARASSGSGQTVPMNVPIVAAKEESRPREPSPPPRVPDTPPPIGEPQEISDLIVSSIIMTKEARTSAIIEALQRVLYAEPVLDHGASLSEASAAVGVHYTKNPKQTLGAARDAWMLIGSRVMAIVDPEISQAVRSELLRFFMEDCRGRFDFAIQWLFEEFMNDHKHANDAAYEPQYSIWLGRVLTEMKAHLDVKDRTIAKLLLDVPSVDGEEVREAIKGYCEDSERVKIGLSTIVDLIQVRPAVRTWALEVLLEYCITQETQLRKLSIVLVKRWVPDHPSLAPRIEEFALQTLRVLLTLPNKEDSQVKMEDVKMEEHEIKKEDEWSRADVVRHLELYFALCSRKQELLHQVLVIYKSLSLPIRNVIDEEIPGLIKSMGQGSLKLLEMLKVFPDGSDNLALIILQTLTKDEKPTPALVHVIKHVLNSDRGDGRWAISILSGLDKMDVLSYLPKIVSLLDGSPTRHALVKEAFARLVDVTVAKEGLLGGPVTTLVGAAPGGSSAAASADMAVFAPNPNPVLAAVTTPAVKGTSTQLTPTELLITLHRLEDQVGLKRTMEATQICFETANVFKQEVLATTLQTLVELPKIPNLMMRTALQAIKTHRGLQSFMNSILVRLISRKVWTEPKVWQGFVLCCASLQPTCYPVLLTMEPDRLRDFLTMCSKNERRADGTSSIKTGLKRYIASVGDRDRARTQVQRLAEVLNEEVVSSNNNNSQSGNATQVAAETPTDGDGREATTPQVVSVS
ncbi:hypothetical protein SmJEL517_g00253 [Synchytrium microbalum]|uniref:Symplekin n=1 Tax=Synchytrium microbalum TaxID=1806994 RepID=A0A507CER0_9FUNG|nr:uncharacterized protein SmJEL517_g00253 [Synchytrium microbalum]TPX37971.1 hypothetical protein SmJEL517_g00253 [Synchytrium microbalum]